MTRHEIELVARQIARILREPLEEDALVDLHAFAKRIGVGHRTAHQHVLDGKVPSYKVGGRRMVRSRDISEFIERCRDQR